MNAIFFSFIRVSVYCVRMRVCEWVSVSLCQKKKKKKK